MRRNAPDQDDGSTGWHSAHRGRSGSGREWGHARPKIARTPARTRRADKIVSREELSSAVWGREFRSGDRSIDVYVHKLRVKLEAALPGWSFIHTHSGFGYRLWPQVRRRKRT